MSLSDTVLCYVKIVLQKGLEKNDFRFCALLFLSLSANHSSLQASWLWLCMAVIFSIVVI